MDPDAREVGSSQQAIGGRVRIAKSAVDERRIGVAEVRDAGDELDAAVAGEAAFDVVVETR